MNNGLRCIMFWHEGDDEPYTMHYVGAYTTYEDEQTRAYEFMINELGFDEVELNKISIAESYPINDIDGYKITLERV